LRKKRKMTGHSVDTHNSHSHTHTATNGDIHWDTTTSHFYIYTDGTTTTNHTWVYPSDTTTWDIGTSSGEWSKIYIDSNADWVPVKCKCCDRDIKEKDDGLSIKMGDKEF